MERSLFTKIIDREIPATIEYEDDSVIAIRDIAPVAAVHILIIPKKPLRNVNSIEQEDQAVVGHVFHVAGQLAAKFNISETGYRVVTNTNYDAGQTVPHLHFHLLGGEPLGGMRHHPAATSAAATSAAATPDAATLAATTPAAATLSTFFKQTFWRDLAIFVVASVGLAYGYNELNPKHIRLVRPVYATDTLATTPTVDSTLSYVEPAPGPDTALSASALARTKDSLRMALLKQDSLKRIGATNSKGVDTTKAPLSAPCFEAQTGVIKEIKYEQFVAFLSKPCVVLLDARIPETYAKGHIGNAINVNGTEAESPAVIQKLIGIPRDKIVLIYCDGGECELSHRVADVLKNFGYGPIYIYTGGWAEWSKKK